MHGESRQIVGIAGGSCAGKTWLADELMVALKGKAARLSLDDFYIDRSSLSPGRRARVNFDHPRAVEWARLEGVLREWREGQKAAVPCYDFATHSRLADEKILPAAPVVIVEGLWLFRRASLRRLFDLKIFLRSSEELCVSRRLERDTRERGRSREDVLRQVERDTLPMFRRFVEPQERWADVILEAPVRAREVEDLGNRIAQNSFCEVGI